MSSPAKAQVTRSRIAEALFASLEDAIVGKALDGTITDWSAGAERLYGYTAAEIIGQPFSLLVPPERQAEVAETARRLAAGQRVDHFETVRQRKDGRRIDVSVSYSPVHDEQGRLIGMVAMARDISDRVRAERRRNARQAATQMLARSSDPAAAMPQILQTVCEALNGLVGIFWVADAAAGLLRCAHVWHPAGQAERFITASREQTWASGEGLPGRVWQSGRPLWISNGTADEPFPRQANAADDGLQGGFAVPVYAAGEILGVLEFFSPDLREPDPDLLEMMTTLGGQIGQFLERRRTEEQLRRSERELVDFFETAAVGLHWVGPDGTILRVNQAELDLLGYTRDEYIGRHIAEFHVDPEVIADILARLRAGERLYDYPARLRCKDGSIKQVLIDSSVLWENGEFIHTRCFTRDVTARRITEALLAEEARITDTLRRVGSALAAELDLNKVVQVVTDEATRITGAQFGAFFYNVVSPQGETYTLYTVSGVPRSAFESFPMPRNTAIFEPTFRGTGVVRLADVTADPRYGKNAPYHGMPEGHPPVRSYLAVPVTSRSGEVLGGLFFGHAEPGVFTERAERVVVGIAAQAAVAIDNARLYGRVQESEQRFRQLAEHITGVFWLSDPVKTRILYVSPGYEQVWGRTVQSLYDQPRSYLDAIHPADRPRVLASLARQAAGEATAEEYRIVRPDGTVRWVWDRGFPVRDDSGRVYRIAGVAEDITERRRAEYDAQFLANASAALASVVDYQNTLQKLARLAVPDFADWCAVDMPSEDGVLQRVAVAHVDPARVELAHQLHRRFPPDPNASHGVYHILRTGRAELVPRITDAVLAASVQDPEYLQVLRELGLRSYIGVPLTARGKTLGVMMFIAAESGRQYDERDLALAEDLAHRAAVAVDNARLYEALRESDRRKDEFLAMLAHELRNPLAPILTGLHILRTPTVAEPARQKTVGMMERQIDYLVRLVDDLLDVSRIMRGKIELRKELVDLDILVTRAVEMARPFIDAEGHRLVVELPAEPLRIEADPVRVAQVLGNLLHNAAKYTDHGGTIQLTAHCEGCQAVVRVRDTGIGIAPEFLPRIFDMFVQADRRTKSSQGGMGIGLTLVRSLVEMHGGQVEAFSDGPGRGSEFVIRLPLATTHHGPMPAADPPASAAPVLASPASVKVLVVDDNIDAADSLAMLLRLQGHAARVALDGSAALNLAAADPPDVAFLDLGMPGMDGYELARRFREDPILRRVRLVALTGWGQEQDRRRTKEAGFDLHLVKPAEPEAIQHALSAPSHESIAHSTKSSAEAVGVDRR
jgi:PAS domain S-box-containing protein